MEILLALVLKLIPLYILIFLGLIAGKVLSVKKESVATLLIYIISPVVIFNGALTTKITWQLMSLPILFFVLSSSISLIFYYVAKYFYHGSEKNILSFAAGTGNTGYFGIPVVLALFGETYLSVTVLCILGFVLYENTLGFFITAKGHHTAQEAFYKLLKLPTIYAFLIGLALNIFKININSSTFEIINHFRSAYIVLGMMLVGLGLAEVTRAFIDFKFISIAFFARFIFWPIVMVLIVFSDSTYLYFYNLNIYKILLIMGIVPLASNTVAYATKLNTHPEKIALTVLLSTLLAIIYIPLFVTFIFPIFIK